MPVTLRNVGNPFRLGQAHCRASFQTSTGSTISLSMDANPAGGGGSDTTGVEKIFVYENSTLVKSIVPPSAVTAITYLTGALFPDNSLGIWITFGGRIYYTKVGPSPTYTQSAWETVVSLNATTQGNISEIDGCVTDNSVPIVSFHTTQVNRHILHGVYTRRTSDSSWVSTRLADVAGATILDGFCGSNTLCALGSPGTNLRSMVFAYSYGSITSGKATDAGITVGTAVISETTGAFTTGFVARQTGVLEAESIRVPTGAQTRRGRHIKLFRSDADEYTCGFFHYGADTRGKTLGLFRGTWTGSAWKQTLSSGSNAYSSGVLQAIVGNESSAISYSHDTLHYLIAKLKNTQTSGKTTTTTAPSNWSGIIKVNRSTSTSTLDKLDNWWVQSATTLPALWLSGGDRNIYGLPQSAPRTHTAIGIKFGPSGKLYQHYAGYVINTTSPGSITPGNGTVSNTGKPVLGASTSSVYGTSNANYHSGSLKLIFELASDSSFATNFMQFIQPDTSFVNSTKSVTSPLPSNLIVSQGLWYLRARYTDKYGNVGTASPYVTFSVSHPPTSINQSPSNREVRTFGTTGAISFIWKFADTFSGDTQTAFRIICEVADTGATVFDTGKITSTAQSYQTNISEDYKDLTLRWRLILWDSGDVDGPVSDNFLFILATPALPTDISPQVDSIVTSGVPTVTFTVNAPGDRTVISYNVSITKGNQLVWNSGNMLGNFPNGSVITVSGDGSYLKNNESYSLQINFIDSLNLQSTIYLGPFSTSWILPAAPVGQNVDKTNYNLDDKGYVLVNWDDTTRDDDFAYWNVYRKSELIDPATGLSIEIKPYEFIESFNEVNIDGYSFRDYLAPSGMLTTYQITQVVNRFGDVVESAPSPPHALPTILDSDGYWLITPDGNSNNALVIKVRNVTADSYSDEQEESQYTIIGRGRHFDIGDDLGYAGSLSASIRGNGPKSARQRKLELEAIQKTSGSMYMRNPFGDIFKVHLSALNISRLSGVGSQEFVDVTIPYSEVE